jgi:hypothetical protein
MNRLEFLNIARKHYGTLYDKIQLDYTYMEYLLDHVEDVSPYRKEIVDLHESCKEYVLLYEESIYKQLLWLLEQLRNKL